MWRLHHSSGSFTHVRGGFHEDHLFEQYPFVFHSMIYLSLFCITNVACRGCELRSKQPLCVTLLFFFQGAGGLPVSVSFKISGAEDISKMTACGAFREMCLALKRFLPIFVVFPGHKPVQVPNKENNSTE